MRRSILAGGGQSAEAPRPRVVASPRRSRKSRSARTQHAGHRLYVLPRAVAAHASWRVHGRGVRRDCAALPGEQCHRRNRRAHERGREPREPLGHGQPFARLGPPRRRVRARGELARRRPRRQRDDGVYADARIHARAQFLRLARRLVARRRQAAAHAQRQRDAVGRGRRLHGRPAPGRRHERERAEGRPLPLPGRLSARGPRLAGRRAPHARHRARRQGGRRRQPRRLLCARRDGVWRLTAGPLAGESKMHLLHAEFLEAAAPTRRRRARAPQLP